MKKYGLAVLCVLFTTVALADDNQFIVQSGAFKNSALANGQAAKVSLLGVPSTVVELKNEQGETIRVVRSSKKMLQKEAEEVVDRLDKEHIHAMLLSI